MIPTIKIATDKDFPSIVPLMNKANEYFTRIVNETRGKNAPHNKPFRFHDGMLLTARFLYMEINDTPIACLTVDHWPLKTPVVVLDDLWVEPEYRRKGYGKALVEYAMDMIHKAERHAEIGILAGNTGAAAFWYAIMPSLVKMQLITIYLKQRSLSSAPSLEPRGGAFLSQKSTCSCKKSLKNPFFKGYGFVEMDFRSILL